MNDLHSTIGGTTDEALVYEWEAATDRMLVVRIISENNKKLLLDPRRDAPLRIGNTDEEIAFADARFLHGGQELLLVTDYDDEFLVPQRYNLETGIFTKLPIPVDGDVEQVVLSHAGELLALTVNDNGVSRLLAVNPADDSVAEVTGFSPGIIRNLTLALSVLLLIMAGSAGSHWGFGHPTAEVVPSFVVACLVFAALWLDRGRELWQFVLRRA